MHKKDISFPLFIRELFYFTLKQLRAILFPILFIILLLVSNYVSIPGVYRYDFLFLGAVVIQILLLVFKLETKDEAKTILLFHVIGLVLELFKTHPSVGSWSYPEMGFFKIGNVPLYSGFMYASVGSYIAAAWKIFKLDIINHPPYRISIIVCAFIYLNFFTNHFMYDYRLFLFLALAAIYYKTWVSFTVTTRTYKMPLLLSFGLIGFFVWIAENVATFYGAWKYPGQIHEWHVVSFHKITSWFLLVIICFIVVAYLKYFKKKVNNENT